MIKPEDGNGLAYVDWSQQEFGIAAALSQDQNMIAAYESGDPYLTFAKHAGAAPEDATKESHPAVRDQYKACVLAVQYGMGADSLALRIGQPAAHARELFAASLSGFSSLVYRRRWCSAVECCVKTKCPMFAVPVGGKRPPQHAVEQKGGIVGVQSLAFSSDCPDAFGIGQGCRYDGGLGGGKWEMSVQATILCRAHVGLGCGCVRHFAGYCGPLLALRACLALPAHVARLDRLPPLLKKKNKIVILFTTGFRMMG